MERGERVLVLTRLAKGILTVELLLDQYAFTKRAVRSVMPRVAAELLVARGEPLPS